MGRREFYSAMGLVRRRGRSRGRAWMLGAMVAYGVIGCSGDKEESPSCEAGKEGCACYPNNSCNEGLSCLSKLCVDSGVDSSGGRGGSTSGGGSLQQGGEGDSSSLGGSAGSGGTARGGGGGQGGSPTNGGSAADGGTQARGGAQQGGAQQGGAQQGGAANTPVQRYGALSVNGANLVDEQGKSVKLEGISSMWLNWDPTGYAQSKAALQYMRDSWNLRVFRAAMGVDAEGAYLLDPDTAKAQVNRIVQNAIDLGVYVIIDWHDHEALAHADQARAFFDEMSKKWGEYPNVMYEVFNEPLDLDWGSQLKPYHASLVDVIRKNDPDNIILLGTPNWDQDVDVAAQSPLAGKNLMYTLHFYACSHAARERSKAQTARSRGLPMFVTEWGATHADGGVDGVVCEGEARTWHDFLDQHAISWAAWKMDGCTDSSCLFKNRDVPVDGGWTAQQLNGHAPLVIDEMKTGPESLAGTGGGGSGGSTSMGGASSGGTGGTAGGTTSFPPDPAGCELVTSCTDCCETTGVYGLDPASMDATGRLVKSFSVEGGQARATFQFSELDEVGGIFFKLTSPRSIESIGLTAGGDGDAFEVALVNGSGANGCLYDLSSAGLASEPYTCWENGAGPSAGEPVDQIEVRVRALQSGPASLVVQELEFGP
ncbi:MAG TPA: glycoside hydrolase family 5 protein [Polyangiaceae bacterium]|nr:glycoside hydrolase family 5 protein [Polyangiaceae bacterium]